MFNILTSFFNTEIVLIKLITNKDFTLNLQVKTNTNTLINNNMFLNLNMEVSDRYKLLKYIFPIIILIIVVNNKTDVLKYLVFILVCILVVFKVNVKTRNL
jgi:hypothetical protein